MRDYYALALVVQVAISFCVACLLAVRRTESAFSPMLLYFTFHAVVFVLRPVLEWGFQLDAMWAYMGYYPTVGDRVRSLAVSSLALLCIVGGYIFATRGLVRSSSHSGALPGFTEEGSKALITTVALVAPFALYSLWVTRGGVGLSDRASVAMEVIDGVIVSTSTTGYLTDIQNAILGLVGLCLAVRRWRAIALLLLGAYLARKLMTGGGRWGIILPLASYALIYMHVRRLKWPPLRFAALAVPVLAVFVILGEDRYAIANAFEGRGYESNVRQGVSLRDRLDGPDFANFEYLTYVAAVVPEQTNTFTYGTQYLQLLTEPVPRALWAGKPAGPPIKLLDLNNHGNFFGMTTSLPGDLWLSLGWLGVGVGGLLVGLSLGRLYRSYLRGKWDAFQTVAYLMTLPLLIQFYRDGGIVSFSKFVAFVVLPVFFVRWLSKMRVTRRNVVIWSGD